MGALHEGHLSLVEQAKKDNDHVVSSIFVNPAQFGPNEDLDTYPRQLHTDAALLESLGVDLIFAPQSSDMYKPYHTTYVDPEIFNSTREGLARPGFFKGVATIVMKLFNIATPTRAYFGQKDAVQCCVIRRMVDDMNVPVEVVIMPTVREADGLAMSSRNAYLSEEERPLASVVYKSLQAAESIYSSSTTGTIPASQVVDAVNAVLHSEPLITDVQYVAVDNKENMQPLEEVVVGEGAVVSLAVKLGSVRLIDNIVL